MAKVAQAEAEFERWQPKSKGGKRFKAKIANLHDRYHSKRVSRLGKSKLVLRWRKVKSE